jgi:hypothetical protein
MNKYIFIFLFFYSLLITSCATDEQCRTNKDVEMGIGFYHVVVDDSTKVVTRSSLSIDSLTIRGLKYDSLSQKYTYADSVLYNNSKSTSKVYLPLHKFNVESKFEVTFNQTKDTITVLHENINDYLSLECGCMIIHTIDTLLTTNHFVDSIRIKQHNVNTNNVENIQLYK